jgi:PAS domain S-box-containing protein
LKRERHRTQMTASVSIRTLRGLVAGAIVVALLSLIKAQFAPWIGHPTPFLLYFAAALAASWWGDIWAGAATTVLAAIAGSTLFLEGEVDSTASIITTSVYVIEGLTIATITSWLHSEQLASRRALDEASMALRKLRGVLAGVGEGITMLDASGKLIYANEGAAKMNGFSRVDEMLRTPVANITGRFEMFREDGTPMPNEELPSRIVLRRGGMASAIMRFRVRDTGAEHWAAVTANAVLDSAGAVQFVVTVFDDITEKRRHEHELQLSREWFETALTSIGDAVITTDRNGIVTFLNPIAVRLTGWPIDAARGRRLEEVFRIVNEETRQPSSSPVERVLRDGNVVGLANHTILMQRDGGEVAIDDSAAPIKTATGDLVGVVLVFRDVSAKRRRDARETFLARASAEIHASLDYEATLATVARLAVPTIADWCAIDMVEPAGGLKRLAVAHVDAAKIEMVRDVQRRFARPLDPDRGVGKVLRTGEPELMELIPPEVIESRLNNDEERALVLALELHSYIAVPIKAGGSTIGVITLVMAESKRRYDVEDLAFAVTLAERAAVAIEHARLYREIEVASRSKDEFLAMLGHELRNPLAPILTAIELMERVGDDRFDRERGVIARQVKHMTRLVDDLLDVSRITRGKIELERTVVDVADVVARAVEMASPLIESRGQKLEVDVPRGLEVDADPMRLAQAFSNIVQNAAKYTGKHGHIGIRGDRVDGEVVVRIQDDGVGIAGEMLPRVFDLFAQERQALDRASGGLGIGLAIVRSLVAMHGGSVEAHSDGPGHGSEFVVRLPERQLSAASGHA